MPIEGYGVREQELIDNSATHKFIIGDIFKKEHFPGISTITTAWHLSLSLPDQGRRESTHKISFRHGQLNGNWVLIVDGIIRATGYESPIIREFELSFHIHGINGKIICDGLDSVKYFHSLTLNNDLITPLNKLTISSLGERIPLRVSIPDTRTYSLNHKKITVYQISVEPATGRNFVIERRYSEFEMLNDLIHSQTEYHIAQSLPNLPGKVYTPFKNQFSSKFIEKRRNKLEIYLQYILANDKVS